MLRILSDLHLHDASCPIRKVEDLSPLLHDVDELWICGDSCDNQSGIDPDAVAAMRSFFEDRVATVRFITGNHDPDISTTHELQTAEGRLWAVHGDVFLDDIVPWSRARDQLVARLGRVRQAHPELDFNHLPDRLRLMRLACTGFHREFDPQRTDILYKTWRLMLEFFPPRQAWAMFRTWRTFADQAIARADQWRPHAQIIVTGHVHFPRVWQRGHRHVINCGAFPGPLGAFAVDLVDDVVTVHRITSRGDNWYPDRTVATIPLAAPHSDRLTTEA
ncbi:metallophosphoesterase [Synoicihabitans lomoniglobus]|uniref:Metallophosphoesterase n=1 Tax=Synoicihabitans lomoniglobus TaxID=2909285 RepID=A0AAF0CQ87_9BACT|nr:metallophosphoesterase [Opitutaceae bacterium LMO-M01]WED66070.1 metallophosphoesterase [Opitutaceae bacterium LMO-M01]